MPKKRRRHRHTFKVDHKAGTINGLDIDDFCDWLLEMDCVTLSQRFRRVRPPVGLLTMSPHLLRKNWQKFQTCTVEELRERYDQHRRLIEDVCRLRGIKLP